MACSWFFSSVSADLLLMNFQAISNSSVEPDSKPWESWKIKLLPGYVIWCSISCRPFCYHSCEWIHSCTYYCRIHLKWWHQMDGRLLKLITCNGPNSQRKHKLSILHLTYSPCHIWWALLPLLHHKPSQGWLSCLHWPSQWPGCESVGNDSVPWAFEPVYHLHLICFSQSSNVRHKL